MKQKSRFTCALCGQRLPLRHSGRYDPATRRRWCRSCARELKKDAREERTGMRQSTGAMIAKLAFGTLFLATAVLPGGERESVGGVAAAVIMGLALLAWGLIPLGRALYDRGEDRRLERDRSARLETTPWRCPNCGATTRGPVCEYCGSAPENREEP